MKKMAQFLSIVFCSVILVSCSGNNKSINGNFQVNITTGKVQNFIEPGNKSLKVFLFISPDCPLCINYTKEILSLMHQFNNSQVQFNLVYPGDYYSLDEIKNFENKYDLHTNGILDTQNIVTKLLNATITPQAVLLNSENEIVYSGAIDNRAVAPGKKRQVITQKYLSNAIENVLQGKHPNPSKTEAIGCFIEI